MRRNYRLYLEDIMSSAQKILHYVGDLSHDEFAKDEMRVDAVVRNFEIIGEAASNIPPEVRDKYSSVEWRRIIDLRNVLVHEYFGVNLKVMWDIIKNKLPGLAGEIRMILEKEA
jgi:uncharacterized protein with HEPN domain